MQYVQIGFSSPRRLSFGVMRENDPKLKSMDCIGFNNGVTIYAKP
jgi:hypothetical protein